MQVLDNKELVPNYTLQRLIQIWSDSAPTRPESLGLDQDQARRLVDQIKNNDVGGDCVTRISKLISFAIESDENRKFLASIDGFIVVLLVKILGPGRNFQLAEKVIQLCGVILVENQDAAQPPAKLLVMDKDRIDVMILLLQRGCLDSRIATVKVIEMLAGDLGTKVFMAEQSEILAELLRQISIETNLNVIEAYMSCLICLSLPKRIRSKIVRLGAVKILGKMLNESSTTSVPVVEKELKLLELVSTCKEGRFEICENDGGDCVKAIVNKVLKVSGAATELAVTILWSLCCLFRDQRAMEAVMKSNGLGKILVLLQSNCSPAVRHMAGDLLKIFKVNSKSCISSYETKTTHIMPF